MSIQRDLGQASSQQVAVLETEIRRLQAEVEQAERERDEAREVVQRGEAVLQCYGMTPTSLAESADWLLSQVNGEPECQEAEIVATLQSVACAFVAYENWLSVARSERDALREERDDARAEVAAAPIQEGQP